MEASNLRRRELRGTRRRAGRVKASGTDPYREEPSQLALPPSASVRRRATGPPLGPTGLARQRPRGFAATAHRTSPIVSSRSRRGILPMEIFLRAYTLPSCLRCTLYTVPNAPFPSFARTTKSLALLRGLGIAAEDIRKSKSLPSLTSGKGPGRLLPRHKRAGDALGEQGQAPGLRGSSRRGVGRGASGNGHLWRRWTMANALSSASSEPPASAAPAGKRACARACVARAAVSGHTCCPFEREAAGRRVECISRAGAGCTNGA